MIRLIVSDIDGTLTEDGGSRLDPELYEVILKLKSQGIYFAAASGRHSASIEYKMCIRDRSRGHREPDLRGLPGLL